MAKTINITFEDVTYTLEFTRKSIKTMESRGFKISEFSDKPVTMLPALFAGAFLAHHRFVKQDVIEEIFARLKNKEELLISFPKCMPSLLSLLCITRRKMRETWSGARAGK